MEEFDLAENEARSLLGSELGSYRLIKLLGVGGMGRVYLAEHTKLGRKVALKLLLPELSVIPEAVERFFNEARAVNQINHPNIVEVMDFVADLEGHNYFIMELLSGRELQQVRDTGSPFRLEQILSIIRQVASALAAAHSHGIVHRDIKPGNILLMSREGRSDFVKLLDFGIAKLTSSVLRAQKTRTGLVLGTPGFMSPEQARGQHVDGRSDIYSLGVLIYWMLVDQMPYAGNLPTRAPDGPSPKDKLSTTASGQAIPPQLASLVQSCLLFDPDERLQTMERLLEELPVLRRPSERAPPPLPPRPLPPPAPRNPTPPQAAPNSGSRPVLRNPTPAQLAPTAVSGGLGPRRPTPQQLAPTSSGGEAEAAEEAPELDRSQKLLLAGLFAVLTMALLVLYLQFRTPVERPPHPVVITQILPPPPAPVTPKPLEPVPPSPSIPIAHTPSPDEDVEAAVQPIPPPPVQPVPPPVQHHPPKITPTARGPHTHRPKPKGKHAGSPPPDDTGILNPLQE